MGLAPLGQDLRMALCLLIALLIGVPMKFWERQDGKWFGFGAVIGFVVLSIALASVPRKGQITDDTAIYQDMSEIRVPRESKPNFDNDIQKLSNMESRYHEKIPLQNSKTKNAMNRVNQRPYHYNNGVAKNGGTGVARSSN